VKKGTPKYHREKKKDGLDADNVRGREHYRKEIPQNGGRQDSVFSGEATNNNGGESEGERKGSRQ